jgi:dihydrofolate synthase / folylpolyglutamate synthase
MQATAIKTHRIEQTDLLEEVLDAYVRDLVNDDILVITSKIISVLQGAMVPKNSVKKRDLIEKEADYVLDTPDNPYDLYLTLKNNILIPSAGIDESNVHDAYVLYPKDIQGCAIWIWEYLRKSRNLDRFGVVITDSHTTIMRRGVTGIALGWCGFDPLYSYVGAPDLYGCALQVTQINILDALAGVGVFVMGEGREQTPLALIRNAPRISFVDHAPRAQDLARITISLEEDLYAPLLSAAKWRQTS